MKNMQSHQLGFNPNYSEQAPSIEEIKSIEGYALLEFGTSWCGHCEAAFPVIKAVLSKEKLPHIKVMDGKGKSLGRLFNVKLWPTLILLKNGNEIARVVRPTQVNDVEKIIEHTQNN